MTKTKCAVLCTVAFLIGDLEGVKRSKYIIRDRFNKFKDRIEYLERRNAVHHEFIVSISNKEDIMDAINRLVTKMKFIDVVDTEF